MAKWSMDLQEYSKKQQKKVLGIKNRFLFALYSRITERTPVDTGRARGNWNISVNKEDVSTDRERFTPKYNSEDEAPKSKGDETMFISNGLEYIEGLEYGRSKQAPEGMVGVTLADSQNILNDVIDGVLND